MARRKFSFDARRWDGRPYMRNLADDMLEDLDDGEKHELLTQLIDAFPEVEEAVRDYAQNIADRRHSRDRRPGRDQGNLGPSSELEGVPPSEQREYQQAVGDYHRRGRQHADDLHRKVEEDLARHWGTGRDAVPQRARDRANDAHHKIEEDYRSHHGAFDAAPQLAFAERFPEAAAVGVNNLF